MQRALERVEHLGAQAQASENVGAPQGTTMNSWKSTLLSAWAPPLSTFIIGTGSTRAASRRGSATAEAPPRPPAPGRRRARRRGSRWRPAATCWACRPARSGAVEALLLGGVHARDRLRDLAVDVRRPPSSRPCPASDRRRRAAPSPRTRRSKRPTAPPRGRAHRSAAPPPPPPSDCPGCRGSAGRGLARSRSSASELRRQPSARARRCAPVAARGVARLRSFVGLAVRRPRSLSGIRFSPPSAS